MSINPENSLDINNFSINDILKLLELTNPSPSEIRNKINSILHKPNIKKNQHLIDFFLKAQRKLINYENKINQDEEGEEDEEDEEYEGHEGHEGHEGEEGEEDEEDEDEEDEYEEDEGHEGHEEYEYHKDHEEDKALIHNMQYPKLSQAATIDNYKLRQKSKKISPTYQVPILQGRLNPNLRNIVTRNIIIDSAKRSNILPYSTNPLSETNTTNYKLVIDTPLKNVISMKLHSVHIPTTWHVFDPALGNTYFFIDDNRVDISSGNYDISNLITTINTNTHRVTKISNLFTYNHINNKVSITAQSGTAAKHSIIFYDATLTHKPPPEFLELPKINQNLGWSLGFRIRPIDSGLIILTLGKPHQAQAPIDIFGPKYFTLSIDDYNRNYNNNGVINIGSSETFINLPSHFTRDFSYNTEDCKKNTYNYIYTTKTNSRYDKTLPVVARKDRTPNNPARLTQHQIYSINEKISNAAFKQIVNNTLSLFL